MVGNVSILLANMSLATAARKLSSVLLVFDLKLKQSGKQKKKRQFVTSDLCKMTVRSLGKHHSGREKVVCEQKWVIWNTAFDF